MAWADAIIAASTPGVPPSRDTSSGAGLHGSVAPVTGGVDPRPGVGARDQQDGRRPVLVIHGIGTRDRQSYLSDVAGLNEALGGDVRLIPVYWGDMGATTQPLDTILPYLSWSSREARLARESSAEVRGAVANRDLGGLIDTISAGWRRRSGDSRRRILGSIYSLVRTQYQRASGEFTGDLILYQRRQAALHARIWETVMEHAPGYGLAGRPIDVISHSLGGAMLFDLAVAGFPTLHIGEFLTCASQISYFHVIGCSPVTIDPTSSGRPVTLPGTIGRWTNYYVPLDPWAFLTAPLFTLADGSIPDDLEVYGADRGDRVLTHAATYYWTHPVFIESARQRLGVRSGA